MMTEKKREFLQETAFEEDINLDDPYKTDKLKKEVADRFYQWMQKDKK